MNFWKSDAVSLVEAFRKKKLSPKEALESCLSAINGSKLNAFCYLDTDTALKEAETANINLPFGGIPFGIKELDAVMGWPHSEASLLFKDRIATYTSTYLTRLKAAGAIFLGQTTASEFGGINCTHTKIHGTTRNPWNMEKTPGGSSGGTAAAVAGGLVPIGTGGDGGGSIRIPAGFTGLFGLKVTYGRIPKGPKAEIAALTAVLGCLSRSVRDTARFLDVTNGHDNRDPLSLERKDGYERNLGNSNLSGLKVVVSPDLFGSAVVEPRLAEKVYEAASNLIKLSGLEETTIKPISIPELGMSWAASNLVGLYVELKDLYPDKADELTPEINLGMNIATNHFNLAMAAENEAIRREVNEAMAEAFDTADFIITATNPDVAFKAEGPLPTQVGGIDLIKERGFLRAAANNGALTIPGNLYGCPAVSIPIGELDGLPIGMQILAPHFKEDLLLDLSLIYERNYPWPMVAPGAPL